MPRLATEKETDSVRPLSEKMKLLLYFRSFAKDELFFIPRSESEGKARQKREKFLMTAILSQAQSYFLFSQATAEERAKKRHSRISSGLLRERGGETELVMSPRKTVTFAFRVLTTL